MYKIRTQNIITSHKQWRFTHIYLNTLNNYDCSKYIKGYSFIILVVLSSAKPTYLAPLAFIILTLIKQDIVNTKYIMQLHIITLS